MDVVAYFLENCENGRIPLAKSRIVFVGYGRGGESHSLGELKQEEGD